MVKTNLESIKSSRKPNKVPSSWEEKSGWSKKSSIDSSKGWACHEDRDEPGPAAVHAVGEGYRHSFRSAG